jgi:hypothetical protein
MVADAYQNARGEIGSYRNPHMASDDTQQPMPAEMDYHEKSCRR